VGTLLKQDCCHGVSRSNAKQGLTAKNRHLLERFSRLLYFFLKKVNNLVNRLSAGQDNKT
jgi:hypothetical protein